MFTQDESYIKWKLFLEGDDQAYKFGYILITSKCSIIMAYKSLLILK